MIRVKPCLIKPTSDQQGFTLLELVVVLFILTILVGLIIPRMWLPQNLDWTARQMGGLIQALHDKSRATKLMYRLHFNISTGQYWVTSLKGPVDSPVTDTLFRNRRSLPQDVQFQDVMISQRGRVREGDTFMQFFPVGRVEPTVIHLRDQAEVLSLLVHPVTGSVRIIKDHYVPQGWKDVSM